MEYPRPIVLRDNQLPPKKAVNVTIYALTHIVTGLPPLYSSFTRKQGKTGGRKSEDIQSKI
jgi:hypothetical protein